MKRNSSKKELILAASVAIVAAAAIFAGCSCSQDKKTVLIKELPEQEILSGTRTGLLNERVGIYDIDKVGDCYLCTEKRTPMFYSLYDRDFNLITQFGVRGRSENEFLAPLYAGNADNVGDCLSFRIFDRAQYRLDTWTLDRTAGTVSKTGEMRVPTDKVFDMRILYAMPDNGFCGVSDDSECRYFTASEGFDEVVFHDNSISFANMEAHDISQTCSTLSPDNKRVALGYYSFPLLEIRDVNGSILKSVWISRKMRPEDIDLDAPDDYFMKTVASGDYIYALYNDASSEENDDILVFDWDGHLQHRYRVRKALSFCVDLEAGRIVLLNSDQGEGLCTIYGLPR